MLTDNARQLLAFEDEHPAHVGGKVAAIRATFGVTAARYYQRLIGLINTPEAVAAEPVLVHRLQRQLHERTTARRSRVFAREERATDR